jgi:hypothetical protein
LVSSPVLRTVMSATTAPTTASPPLHHAPAPGALSGLTVVLPCLDEAENLREVAAGRDAGPGPRLAASTLCELADLRRALHEPRIPGVGV